MSQMSQPQTTPSAERPGVRSHQSQGSRTFSFRSDKSGGSRPKDDLSDSPRDKARRDSIWKGTSKANPNAAIHENQPGGVFLPCLGLDSFRIASILRFCTAPISSNLRYHIHSFCLAFSSSWLPHKPYRPFQTTLFLLMRRQSMPSLKRARLRRCVACSTEM